MNDEPRTAPEPATAPEIVRVKKRGRLEGAVVVGALLVALGGGSIAAKQLLESGAAVTASSTQHGAQAQLAAATKTPATPYLGPFARDAKKGRPCGPEVRLMEGALRLTTPPIRKTPAANCIGIATEKQLKKFQTRHHIPPSGIYGLRTHKALAHAYTKTQRADLAYLAAKRLLALRINTIGIVTAHAYQLQSRMVYCDFGSLHVCGHRYVWPTWPDVPRHTDCSGYVAWVYFQSGLADPNGGHFTGGFTGTLVQHGSPVPPSGPGSALQVGDLIFNGPSASNTTHVSIYIGHGLSSGHGRAGIQIHPWNYRTVVAIRRYFFKNGSTTP